jgi:hypothetical protein
VLPSVVAIEFGVGELGSDRQYGTQVTHSRDRHLVGVHHYPAISKTNADVWQTVPFLHFQFESIDVAYHLLSPFGGLFGRTVCLENAIDDCWPRFALNNAVLVL